MKKLIKREKVVVNNLQSDLLQGKRGLVTGGNSGIGYAIAEKMISAGAAVTIIGRNREKTIKAAERLGCDYLILDMTDTKQLIEELNAYLNQHRIEILVNSAGVRDKEAWLEKTPEGFDMVMNTNLKAVYFMCQTLANDMIKKGIKGHILNISSSSSERPSWGPYQLSKRALNGLTLGFAQRLAPLGITVNGLAPGVTVTPMVADVIEGDNLSYPNPMRRAEAPEEIANMAVVLMSGLGNSVIGDTIMITGGSGNLSFDY
ncbi:SDR family oxidoreductase [Hoylesella shahii]|uniref:SDR family NAD(P)-dependent oxidoreductase n=1 Tax=Hoylesella shahii TaxID=228603 RepID=UPI0028E288AF|nr:SDR family oxidoreductase [Hoylesella shahii]